MIKFQLRKNLIQFIFYPTIAITIVCIVISYNNFAKYFVYDGQPLNISLKNSLILENYSTPEDSDVAITDNVDKKDKNSDNVKACKLTVLNPWDPTISSLISHPKGLYCNKVQRYMSQVDYQGRLSLNQSEIENFLKKTGKYFTCRYRTFDRKPGLDDKAIQYDAYFLLYPNKTVQLKKDTVEVTCFYGIHRLKIPKNYRDPDDGNFSDVRGLFYFNVHAQPVLTADRIFREPTENQLSVLVFLIDSLSSSAFVRNLPLTYAYTKNVMGMDFFKGLNKVGDNSFPNQMAMFMGKRSYDEQSDMPKEMHVDNTTYFDDFPLVWKMFKVKGYTTAFNEDMPYYGLFNYMTQGWTKKSFDFYYHYFWQIATNHEIDGQSWRCFGNVHRAFISMDICKRQLITLKDKLQFIYTIHGELSHDSDNYIEQADGDLLEFWRFLFENNYLNKTFIMFASDHGIRFGKIRQTLIGSLEENNPFYGLWLPSWFHRKYPHIKNNLKNNAEILSSSFDVFETLLDVLNANFNGSQRHWSSRGQSHLYPLPLNRTCKGAGIPDRFCSCAKKSKILDVNSKIAQIVGRTLVAHLNRLLTKRAPGKCRIIQLTKILSATQINFDENLKSIVRNYEKAKDISRRENSKKQRKEKFLTKIYEISLKTEPHGATFEAMLKCKIGENFNDVCSVEGVISRTSQYAGYSNCVLDKELRKFCSCV